MQPSSNDSAAAVWNRLLAGSRLARFVNRSKNRALSFEGGVLTVEVEDAGHLARLSGMTLYGGPVLRVEFVAPAEVRAA